MKWLTQPALAGLQQAIELAARIVGEMAADHSHTGDQAEAAVLREAVEQVRTLPGDVP